MELKAKELMSPHDSYIAEQDNEDDNDNTTSTSIG